MVREVRTLWFRERSWMDYPLITLPLIGDVSPRKLIAGIALGLASYAITAFVGGLVPFIAAIAGFATGLAMCPEPKAVDPFKQMLYMITGSFRPRAAAEPKRRAREVREEVVQVTLEVEPVKIHGIVVDPYTGAPIAGAELVLCVNGRPVTKTVTDSQGRYTFYTHLRPGYHLIEVRLHDQVLMRKRVVVTVRRG